LDPLVSIIVTVYNKGPYVGQTIQSVFYQTYLNLEVVVVDDGSTDDSGKILAAMAIAEPRLKIYGQENAGVSLARNRGLELATGDYVIILDGDDLLYPEFVQKTIEHFRSHPNIDVVHTSWDRIDANGNKIETVTAPESDDYLRDLLLGNMFSLSAMMFRRGILDRAGGFAQVTVEDWEYLGRLAKLGARFNRLADVLSAFRETALRGKKISNLGSRRYFPAIEMLFDGTLPLKYERLKNISVVRHHFFLMEEYIYWGNQNAAKKEFRTGLALLRKHNIADVRDIEYLKGFMKYLSGMEALRLGSALLGNGTHRGALKVLLWRFSCSPLRRTLSSAGRSILGDAYYSVARRFAG
jgi:glycosyltransferase involved in cell wall biosynthesis